MTFLRLGTTLSGLLGCLGLVFLILPFLALSLHMSWHEMWTTWVTSGGNPLATSLWTTAVSLVAIVVFGTPLGWYLSRGTHRAWRIVEFLVLIPLLMPPLVIGLLLAFLYGPYGWIGHALMGVGISATNSSLAVVLAQVYEAAPFYIFAAQAAFSQIDGKHERTSLSLGVSPMRTFWRITIPLARWGLTTGLAMAFARAIGAFGAVIIVAYYPRTLPVSIWIALQEQGLPSALPLAMLLILVAIPVPLVLFLWRGRRANGISL